MLCRKNSSIGKNTVSKKKVITAATVTVALLVFTVAIIFVDPIFILAKYNLRLAKGSKLYELLKTELKGARVAMYIFNITNGPAFISGEDYQLKLQEVGPFVYQEYRSNENLEFDADAAVVQFTPRFRPVFLPDESVGKPEDFVLNVPNLSFLTTSSFISNYPLLIKKLFNAISMQTKSIVKLDVHSQLWGYRDPIVTIIQTLLPGIVYYNSIGILERLYDEKAVYRVEMYTSGVHKFKIKSIEKVRREKEFEGNDLMASKTEYTNTYEGVAFPAELTPDTPLNVLRQGICKVFQLKNIGERRTEFGANAFLYDFDNRTFENRKLCDSAGLCPSGIIDISECFYGLPVGISKTHLLDSNAKVDRLAGLNPDRERHSSRILVDPKTGLTIGTSLPLQLNLVLNDLRYNHAASIFSDMVLPIAHVNITFPEMLAETKDALTFMYITGPRILLVFEIVCSLVGLVLFGYSVKLIQCYRRQVTYQPAILQASLQQKLTAESPLILE